MFFWCCCFFRPRQQDAKINETRFLEAMKRAEINKPPNLDDGTKTELRIYYGNGEVEVVTVTLREL